TSCHTSFSSISPVARLAALIFLLLAALLSQPSTCNGEEDKKPANSPSAQLSVNSQVTPTPLWAVVWGPTQPLEEDATYHLLSSQETDHLHLQEVSSATPGDWVYLDSTVQPQEKAHLALLIPSAVLNSITDMHERIKETLQEVPTNSIAVDPQFYVTVTISSLLILTAVIITAKLCYDRSCSQHPPPLSRGVSLALPRSLASEDSRQTL
uniref:Si:ch211-154o6.4 n=1 Tax=Poecilia formosa TaxID=48698 RepID=A0A096LYA4_POEFO